MNIFNAVLCFLSLNKQIISRILINAGFIFGKLALAKCVTINAKKLDKIGLDCIYCKYCTLFSYFCYFILGTYVLCTKLEFCCQALHFTIIHLKRELHETGDRFLGSCWVEQNRIQIMFRFGSFCIVFCV